MLNKINYESGDILNLIDIFEKVSCENSIEQRRFLNFFDMTVTELNAMYDNFVFEKNTEYKTPEALSDEINILPLYHNAIVDNIIFLSTGKDFQKSEFLRKSRNAYLKYWNDNAKGKKVKRKVW